MPCLARRNVRFLRDEMANMVFAIEEIIPGEIGTGTGGDEAAAALERVLRANAPLDTGTLQETGDQLAQLITLMLVGRLLGEAMNRIGQPSVMGMLLGGILLGPSVLGALLPDFQQALFPKAPEQKAMLDGISQFGILLLLLLTGMETDLKLVNTQSFASGNVLLHYRL